jgi:hypothetical protein
LWAPAVAIIRTLRNIEKIIKIIVGSCGGNYSNIEKIIKVIVGPCGGNYSKIEKMEPAKHYFTSFAVSMVSLVNESVAIV